MKMAWRPIATAPRDGTVFWGWMYDAGILLMRWMTAEEAAKDEGGEPEDYDDGFVECGDTTDYSKPKFWLPLDSIPIPEGVMWAGDISRWRDTAEIERRD